MYKEKKIVYLECDVCGQQFDQEYELSCDVRDAAIASGWYMHGDRHICDFCLHDIMQAHVDAYVIKR